MTVCVWVYTLHNTHIHTRCGNVWCVCVFTCVRSHFCGVIRAHMCMERAQGWCWMSFLIVLHFIFLRSYFYFCVCICACICTCSAYRGQKRAPDPLELKLQAFVSHFGWVLGADLWFFTRAKGALNFWPISLAPILLRQGFSLDLMWGFVWGSQISAPVLWLQVAQCLNFMRVLGILTPALPLSCK